MSDGGRGRTNVAAIRSGDGRYLDRIDRRRTLQALLGAGLTWTAGCLGDDGDGGDESPVNEAGGTDDEPPGTDDGETDGGTTDEATTSDGTTASGAGTTVFDFTTTGRYEYELTSRDRDGWLVWTVEELVGDEATVQFEFELSSGAGGADSFTATPETLTDAIQSVSDAEFIASALFTRPQLWELDVTSLTVGDAWSESIYEFEVVGTDERAGIECTVLEAALGGGSEVYTWDISPEHAMVLRVSTPSAVRWGPWEFTLTEYDHA